MVRQAIIVFTFSALAMFASVAPAQSALILNEALANEPGSSTSLEWVEILNWPDTGEAVSLSGFKYVDGGVSTTLDTAVSIPAGGFAVLARKSTGASSFEERWGNASGVWGDHESESYPLIAMSQISLRNSSDTVRLVSPSGDTSKILWTSDAGDGISIERVRPGSNDTVTSFAACIAPVGSTPGLANSVLPPRGDLAIDTVVIGPASPAAGQPVQFAVRIKNVGFGDVPGGSVLLSRSSDLIGAITADTFGTTLEGLETAIVLTWTDPSPGITDLIVRLGDDSDSSNNGYALTLTARFNNPYLIISEYLANPEPGGPDEWIEIANPSGYTINLKGVRIGDSLNTELIPEAAGQIAPGEFFILAEREAAFRATYLSFDGRLTQIPGWRAINNTGDGIRLIGPSGEIIDSLTFRTTYPDNRSVERVELSPSLAAPGDWAASEDDLGATPGLPNSVQRGEPGSLIIDSVWLAPSTPEWGDTIHVYAAVSNRSFGPAEGWSVVASRDLDFTSPGVSLETIGSVTIPKTNENESQTVVVEWTNASPGIHRVHIALEDETDETVATSALVTTVRFSQPLIIISEYMAAPTSSGPGEWIELYNASEISISLMGIRIGDSLSLGAISPPIPSLQPGEFIVLAQDEERFRASYSHFNGQLRTLGNWPSLNDAGDHIRVLGPGDEIIDSLSFRDLTAQNRSIERRQLIAEFADPRDWGESIDALGATPGSLNSIRRSVRDLSIDSIHTDVADAIEYGDVRFDIWITNRGFETFNDGEVGFSEKPYWNEWRSLQIPTIVPGQSKAVSLGIEELRGGWHTFHASIFDDEDPTNNFDSTSFQIRFGTKRIIVTEYLANPEPNGPGEWIEVLNVTTAPVCVSGFMVGDSSSLSNWLPLDIWNLRLLAPDSYWVLAESEAAFRTYYPNFDGAITQVENWKTLNNDVDVIRVHGPLGEQMDSVPVMELSGANRSRERVSRESTSTDAHGWTPSVDPSGATPGRANSVNAATAGPLRVDVTPNPIFRSAGQTARIDYQLEVGESLTLKIYDRAGREVRTIAEDSPSATGFVEWNGTDDEGHELMPGPYILLARSEPAGSMKKMVVVIAP